MPKKTPEPLLYIQQPEIDFPESDMQEIYMIKKTEGKSQMNNVVQTQKNGSLKDSAQTETEEDFSLQNEPLLEKLTGFKQDSLDKTEELPNLASPEGMDLADGHLELQQIIANYELERRYETESKPLSSKKRHTVSLKRVKSFKEMDMEEKLEYLEHFPKQLPPAPCIFTTGNRFIRGFLLSKMEHEIEIKTFDEKALQISISELKDIQMIGEEK
ncbi:CotO family spore coat protein [Bacillus benzoevorans]|uniref:Spore coat protein CotO n=1 Tax=Bacillus benzoevorans TaxID=1456 RepID=A0A7X0LTJ9_9BACI|nr:CotO family spore coat protein [Bacillus benzoevorans]MBB6443563.1 hypothetical protein [Bacillus benzoevorans]